MIVSSSTRLAIKKSLGLNRCPLKISLIGTTQDVAKEINNENAMVNVLIKDYINQKSENFIVKVVFPHPNKRFKHLMNSIRPNESVLFITGQMEVIQKDLYVYAIETSYVDISTDKKEVHDSLQSDSMSNKSVQSTLFIAHQDVIENSSKLSTTKDHDNNREMSQPVVNSLTPDFRSSKRVKVEKKIRDHVDPDIVEDGYTFEYDEEYANENDGLEESIINQDKKDEHNRERDEDRFREHVDTYIVEDIESNKKYAGESSEPRKNVIDQNKKRECNYKKVYNTRKRTEMFKNVNNKKDEK
jgi:hypothetical protein